MVTDQRDRMIALIPLRGGSRSIPRKNVKLLAGRPLCVWSIRAALDSGVFDQVWVSTDDQGIADIAGKAGARVHRRNPDTATASASSESAMIEFAQARDWDFDGLALVQATSPTTLPEHFREAKTQFDREQADTLVTVTRQHRFLWSPEGKALNYDPQTRPMRQNWDGMLVENGAFYFTKKEILKEKECRLGGKISVFQMPAYTAFEVDEPEDWPILEDFAKRYGYTPLGWKPIRLLALDVDGVLTDAGFYYSESGEALKKFHTRDGAGIDQVRKRGVEVGIITGEATGFASARARKLGIVRMELGCKNKLPVLDAWRADLGLGWDEVAYMGDDLADLECVQQAGIGACPADAEPELIKAADFVSQRDGGRGAVRDFLRTLQITGRIPE